MEQTGEYRVAAARDHVWRALNDPDVLARCIPGCQSFERVADDRYDATVKARVGPVSATFKADLTLQNLDPPNRYTLHADVKGGATGFARGDAHVELSDAPSAPGGEAATRLQYRVSANVGGKLAQMGSRLIDGAARKMADEFFAAFQQEVAARSPEPVPEPPRQDPTHAPAVASEQPAASADAFETGGQWKIWLVVFVALIVTLVLVI